MLCLFVHITKYIRKLSLPKVKPLVGITFSRSSSLRRMLAFLLASAACWSLALTMVSMHWWHFFKSSCQGKKKSLLKVYLICIFFLCKTHVECSHFCGSVIADLRFCRFLFCEHNFTYCSFTLVSSNIFLLFFFKVTKKKCFPQSQDHKNLTARQQ